MPTTSEFALEHHALPLPDIGSYRYLLLDAATLPYALLADVASGLPCQPDGWPDDQTSLLPLLLATDTCDSTLLAQCQQLLVEQQAALAAAPTALAPICALLNATVTPRQLAAHLASRLIIRDPARQDGGRVYWRFYDPRVFDHLSQWLLRPAQHCALLGPIRQWAYVTPAGWSEARCQREVIHNRCGHWPDAEQWQHAENIPQINQLQAQQAAGELAANNSDWACHASLALTFARQQLGWQTAQDCLDFARHALQQQLQPLTDPRLLAALQHPHQPLQLANMEALLHWQAEQNRFAEPHYSGATQW